MISEIIREQIDAGEQAGTAFTETSTDFQRIAAIVCGFLNSRGGVVFVGVGSRGNIVGVGNNPDAVRRNLETYLQKAIAPKALFTLSVDTENDKAIISIETPGGHDIPYVVDGRVYIRSGIETIAANPTLLRELVQGRSVEAERWERRPSLDLDEEDLDKAEIQTTISDVEKTQRFEFEHGDTYTTLRQLNLVVSGGLTNACDVLFAKNPASRHPQCRVRFVQFETNKTGSRYLDDLWAEGPLTQVYNKIIEKVSAQVRVQASFPPGEHVRQDRVSYSIDALREGFVNALAHRDYASFSGGVSLSVYPDRIEIWNAGRLPKGISVGDLKRLHPSIPRNPDIAHVLYLRRLMERIGRGTQKIVTACEELGAPAPKWQDSAAGVTLTIYSAGSIKSFGLNPRQAQMLEQLRPGDTLRVQDYIRDQKVSERQARRDLVELEGSGFLARSGQGRATVYQRTEQTV